MEEQAQNQSWMGPEYFQEYLLKAPRLGILPYPPVVVGCLAPTQLFSSFKSIRLRSATLS